MTQPASQPATHPAVEKPLRPAWYFIPSGWTVPFLVLGVGWTLSLGSCSGVLLAADVAAGKEFWAEFSVICMIMGVFVVPIGAILLFIGALLAGRWPARTSLLVLSLIAALVGLVTSLVGSFEHPDQLLLVALIYPLPLFVLAIMLLVGGVLSVRQVRQGIAQGRRVRLKELLKIRGEVPFDTIAQELRLPASEVPAFLKRALSEHEMRDLVVAEEEGMVFSPDRYAHKEWELTSVVHGRGTVSLADLSKELRLSEKRIREFLATAMGRGVFAGYVDWNRKQVFSADVAALRGRSGCPNCGGAMDLAGRGLIVCPYCAAEVFLS